MKKLFYLLILLPVLFLGISYGGVSPSNVGGPNQGIRKIKYIVEWCSPVYGCSKGHFGYSLGGQWRVEKNGNGFTHTNEWRSLETECSSIAQLESMFNNIKLKAEGEYTITIRAYDRYEADDDHGTQTPCYDNGVGDIGEPGNCKEYVINYRIDKTHPNIYSYPTISESSSYAYETETAHKGQVKELDANSDNSGKSSNGEGTIRGNVMNIVDSPSETNGDEYLNLKTVNYGGGSAGVLLSLPVSDLFPGDKNYVSGIEKVEILDESRNKVSGIGSNSSSNGSFSLSFSTNPISGAGLTNGDGTLYLRAYDKAGNYSEVPFAIVYDNTPPMDSDEFLETFISFEGGENIFPEHDYGLPYYPTKFFAADDSLGITFANIQDEESTDSTDISGPATITAKIERVSNSENCSHNLIDMDSIMNGVVVDTENISVTNFGADIENDMESDGQTITPDFSDSEECLTPDNGSYRYYRMTINTTDDDGYAHPSAICDKVGNCLEVKPILFRVVANEIDLNESVYNVSTKDLAGGKMLANGTSKYHNHIELKDEYKNYIKPVYSAEDSAQLKDNNIIFNFHNRLFQNQVDQSGDILTYYNSVGGTDLDKGESAGGGTNFTTNIEFSERADMSSVGDGIFKFDIFSYVPTYNLYKWIDDNSTFRIENINVRATGTNSGDLVRDGHMGLFNETTMNSGEQDMGIDDGGMGYTDGVNNFFEFDNESSYANATSAGFDGKLNSDRYAFDFGSPLMVGFNELQNVSEGIKNNFKMNMWKFDNGLNTQTNTQLVHDMVTNNPGFIYEYTDKDDVIVKTTDTMFDILGANIISETDKDVDIFGNLSGPKETFGLVLKPYLNPVLDDILNVEEFRFAVVSKLKYRYNGHNITLPSDGRGLKVTGNNDYGDSISYFNGDLGSKSNIDIYDTGELNPLAQSIKITGLQATDGRTGGSKASMQGGGHDTNIQTVGEVKKFEINSNIKSNVAKLMRGRDWNEYSDETKLSEIITDGNIFKVGEETFIPVEGDVTIDNAYEVDGIQTLIVVGKLEINNNIYKADDESLLNIIVLNDLITPMQERVYHEKADAKGFIYVDDDVTDIYAYMYAEGSMMSYNKQSLDKIYIGSNTYDTDIGMFNQLYIKGGVLSKNNIGGSKIETPECPWFQDGTCTQEISQGFDFIYFRRYHLVEASQYGTGASGQIPYIPVSIAEDIDSYNLNHPWMGGQRYCEFTSESSIDCNKDGNGKSEDNIHNDYMQYPMYVEFDPMIGDHRSVLFE